MCSVHRGFNEYIGGGGGGYMCVQYIGDLMSTLGGGGGEEDILSTSGDVQYNRAYHECIGRY